nr:PREDICTED: voltage-dependent T-type calcium channel subunit alpha-1H isoform X3 [Lepisosteus oculatus]XP_015215843.1 PREDICTED: voltage-dependent T-type calcium channel subunit alpha-1H isoform X3 [Lepisosteus oculatus]XP_015215844.1 PREDICTED: voltage-dependent T-type calcium channel subunit alpha-1H isoform X3 [Lepisosteus oculatus]XP_015215845.1 PREDICTED: voltage-dependent T-type calcium channel subunit alpha-1H isoform X3 [Lepisosteus oculatus]XP_015215846.1 PREDICTED: voltage-dependent
MWQAGRSVTSPFEDQTPSRLSGAPWLGAIMPLARTGVRVSTSLLETLLTRSPSLIPHMLVILLNCVTLGMYQPCEDLKCQSDWCTILQAFDDFIFAFFAVEMVIKMLALGIFGQKCYLGDTWNRLDFFIVMAGMMEYSLDGHNVSLSAIRTVRVLRPLRAINRVPSMRILVTLLLDTLPMLGNVLLLCFFVFFIFGIVGVQLWAGLLRNRCFLEDSFKTVYNLSFLSSYYKHEEGEDSPFICSSNRDNGMLRCHDVPRLKENGVECFLSMDNYSHSPYSLDTANKNGCVNWNQYYNVCKTGELNPHKGAINFDNIGYAWIAIFQVITLEGWVDIMYYVMDAHSFYNFIYFILLIIVGSFFMINLCLVVIATQFSETKQRENQLMQEQRARYLSNDSTLASFSEPGSCYEELLKYISHLYRKVKRRAARLYASWQNKRRKKVNPNSCGAGGGPPSRRRRNRRRIRSIHHLVHHHHHHHHHHYHISNGSPRGTRAPSEICDVLEMKTVGPGAQLMLPPASPALQSPSAGTESVHSIYHADCHFHGPQARRKSSSVAGNVRPVGGLNGGKNYPTIVPSTACSRASATPKPKGKRNGSNPAGLNRGSGNLSIPDPYGRLHQLVGEHGVCRGSSRLSGLSIPFPVSGTVPGQLSCELAKCPYCARVLENPELEPSDSESGESDSNMVYEFTQDLRHGADHLGCRAHRQRRPKEKNRVRRCWDAFCDRLRWIVESKYFNRGIMIAILINTLSMGIEYHEQPEELTDVLEISNIVFTSMFALEMLLKLLAFGLFGYIKNPYNIFDGIIVIISVWEIIGQSDGGLSVLRTFRLLRVLKLVRFLPALRRQLVVLMKTMDNVATFCMLLMLFIFIFSILGMHLFGCKFSLTTENGDTIPDRKNFDSLLWAIVTVFQILTQEDWNVVLYNGMASTSPWAALYFVALMTFGNYVLFNLLVAILVEGFQAEGDANRSDTEEDKLSTNFEDDEKMRELYATEMKMYSLMMTPNGHMDSRASIAPPIILRTAATPMPTPKSSPYMDSVHTFSDSRRGSGVSIDPNAYDQRSLSSLRSSPCPPWGSGSNWGSRRSSWNSLGRAPSLKKKHQSGERESLLSGEGRGSTEDEDSDGGRSSVSGASLQPRAESLEQPELLQVPAPRPYHEHQDCNGKTLHLPPDFYLRADPHRDDPADYDDDMDDSYCFRIKKMLEPYKPQWCKDHEDWALYLFSPENHFRSVCQKVITHKMFDHVVLVFIFLNCITIALERPDIHPYSTERTFLSVSNYIFTAIFVAEMTVKVVALGFCSGKNSYLQSSWNILDGVLVFVSIVDIIVSLASAGGAKILGILRVLRLLRTLRPLRVISRAPGLKLVVETLITSLRPIGNIVLICCAFFIIFGILGVQLFKGKFYYCDGFDTKNITNKSDCLQANYRWIRRKYNFDNLGQALMSLFVLSSKDGWVNIMYDGLDAVAVDQQPVRNHNPWMLLYFISFLLIVSFFVLNMFVGVVVENFHKCRQHQEAEEAKRREEKRLKRLEKKRRKAQRRPYYASYSPARLYIHTLCTSHYLDLFITFIIGINVVTMSMEHYNQPRSLEEALKYCNYVFTIIFVFEAMLKLVAFGFRRFFKDRWNQLDLAIVLLSIMGITLEEIEINASLPINPTIIRIMRVLRIARVLKLLKMATGMRALLDTVVQALPQVGNLGLLFMLLFFIYAALGVELFGKLECNDDNPCEGLSRHATFDNFGMAFLTLFRVSTGDNWNGIMKDTLRECRSEDKHCLSYLPLISPIYFVTFVLIAQFVLVNVVVAVLMKHLEESNKEAKEDAEMDAEIEMEMTRRLSTTSGGRTLGPESRATYVGPRPDSPGQNEALSGSQENFLSVRKVSVSRMHSLPNDSYMFRPVRPANAPYPLPEIEPCEGDLQLGSVGSVNSQGAEGDSLLRVPGTSPGAGPSSAIPRNSSMPRIPPLLPSPSSPCSSRLLRRQEAIKHESFDVQSSDSKDNLTAQSSDSLHLKVPGQSNLALPVPRIAAPSSPQPSPTPPRARTSSVHTHRQVYSQHSIPSRAASQTSSPINSASPESSMFGSIDPADEEVRHINSSAKDWGGHSEVRSHSLSPYASPGSQVPGLLKNCTSATSLAGSHVKDKDLKKFYSVDTEGFLAKPSWADDPRRHSIEICPSIDGDDDDSVFEQPADGPRRSSLVSPHGLAVQRKKKMSPPCISVDPPLENELSAPAASLAKISESSMLLRRRTPSCEAALPRDSLDLMEPQPPPEPPAKTEKRPPCRNEHLSVPQFSFDQSDVSSLSSMSDILSDSDQSSQSSMCYDPKPESETGSELKTLDHLRVRQGEDPEDKSQALISVTRSPLRKRGLVRMPSTRDKDTDDSTA